MNFEDRIRELSRGMSEGMEPGVPSRRFVKTRSGRSGRKAYNGQRTLYKVRGYSNDIQALKAPEGAELCVVVPMETGFQKDGKPFRF